MKFPIQIGTIPGNLVIEVRPTDQSSTALQNVDLTLVDPIGTIHVTPLGGGQNLVGGIGADIRANGYLMGGTSSWALQTARMAANGTLGAYNVAPVSYPGQLGIDAMLVYPAGTRLAVSSATNVLLNPPPSSFIVQPSRWVSSGAATGLTFDQAARQNFIAGYPTLAQWLAGASVPEGANGSWNLGPATTGSPTSFDSFGQWFGFGYDVPGTC